MVLFECMAVILPLVHVFVGGREFQASMAVIPPLVCCFVDSHPFHAYDIVTVSMLP